MPSPLAHAVSGYAIFKWLAPQKVQPVWLLTLYAVFVAIAADFDFVPQLITGVKTHRGFTHSLSFGIVFSLVVSLLVNRHLSIKYLKLFALTLVIYNSHLVLDIFTQGGSGVPLLWPLGNQRFQSAIPLFPAVHHSHGLLNSIHLIFLSFELTYTVIVLSLLSRWKVFKHRQQASLE